MSSLLEDAKAEAERLIAVAQAAEAAAENEAMKLVAEAETKAEADAAHVQAVALAAVSQAVEPVAPPAAPAPVGRTFSAVMDDADEYLNRLIGLGSTSYAVASLKASLSEAYNLGKAGL